MKLLFIDDEQTFLKYLAKRLSLDGFSVTTAFSGEEGLDLASKENFDVAIVDLHMPGIDGFEVQKRLKDIRPELPCIILTGHGSIENALESGKYNAFKFLSKPVDMDTLIETIKAANEFGIQKKNFKLASFDPIPASQKQGLILRLYDKIKKYSL